MEKTMIEWHKKRLGDAATLAGGNAALGRKLGHKAGAQIGHMRSGRRPITEKTIAEIEQLKGYKGWFATSGAVGIPVHPVSTRQMPAISVPFLATEGSMGEGVDDDAEDVMVGTLELSARWIHESIKPTAPGRFFVAWR